MKIFEYQLVLNQSMTSTYTSPSQQLAFMINACIQAVFTGTPVGTLDLQVSNDNVNWTVYTGSSTTVNGAGSFAWLLADIGFPWIQVVYTASSSTGSLSVTVNGKGI
jgi:hypothetical protein